MELTRNYGPSSGLLYPLMVIAAIALIVFSLVGMASVAGWMPHAMLGSATAVVAGSPALVETSEATAPDTIAPTAPAFQCAECGVIQSVRDIERRGSLWTPQVAGL